MDPPANRMRWLFALLSMYWGFAPFVVGFPVFLLWIHLTTQPAERHSEWKLLLGCLLLYFSHALWLVAGLVWLVVHDFATGQPLKKQRLRRFAAVAPVIVLAALWYGNLDQLKFTSPVDWVPLPWQRLNPSWLVNTGFGGVRGATEFVMMGLIVLWVLVGVVQKRKDLRGSSDRLLALAGLVLLAAAIEALVPVTREGFWRLYRVDHGVLEGIERKMDLTQATPLEWLAP